MACLRKFLALTATLALACVPLRAGAVTYDAWADFSATHNPNGTWAYGYGTGGHTFTPLPTVVVQHQSANPVTVWQTGSVLFDYPLVLHNDGPAPVAPGTGIWPIGALLIHPGASTDVIVQWTAPTAGIFNYAGFFEVIDHYPTGVITEIFADNQEIYDKPLGRTPANLETLTPGSTNDFSGSIELTAGEHLSFVVNNEGDLNYDGTGFEVQISDQPIGPPAPAPEPATWALVLGGFGLVGAALRRRREAVAA